MASRLFQFCIGITFVKLISGQYQPSVKQYIIRGPQTQQTYNQQPVMIERISTLSLPPGSAGSIGSASSIGSNLIGPGSYLTTAPISSGGSVGSTGSIGSIGASLYGPIGSGSLVSNTQTVNGQISNGLSQGSFISTNSVPGSIVTSIPGVTAQSQKTLTDVNGVLNGLQTLKSISEEGFCGTPSLTSSLLGSSTNPLLTSLLGSSANTLPSLPNGSSKGIDSTVLNNLAIALQLLILSNMLNAEPETEAEPSLFEIIEPLPVKQMTSANKPSSPYVNHYESNPSTAQHYTNHYESYLEHNEPKSPQSELSYPNCNFVGSSGFSEGPMLGLPPKSLSPAHPRSGKCLMSPYEALGNTHEPFGSSYRGFESPYSSMNDNNDLFSMNDLF